MLLKHKMTAVDLIKKVKIIDWILMVLAVVFIVHFDSSNISIVDVFYLTALIMWVVNFAVRMFLTYARS